MIPGLPDIPWEELAAKAALQAWTTAMLGVWDAGLWVLRLALGMIDALVVPDLSAGGPGRAVYGVAFWLAGGLVTVLLLVQLGVAVLRRDGAALAAALTGAAKFLVVWAGWLAYGAAVVAACGGLTRALLGELLQVDSFSAWEPFTDLNAEDITDATVATVLGLMGLLLWLAALGHLVVMITRAGALLVLAAMTPAAAAGLVGEAGRAWFWKSLRWFHAAAFTPVLMVLMLGLGVQLTTGVVTTQVGPAAAVGTALPGVVLILVSCVAPLGLFRLLAFVDPATPSGSAARAAWAAGVLHQLVLLTVGAGGSTSDGPESSADSGSVAEASAAATTERRLAAAEPELLATGDGPAGAAAATAGIQAQYDVGASAASIGLDQAVGTGAANAGESPAPASEPVFDSVATPSSTEDLGRSPSSQTGTPPASGPTLPAAEVPGPGRTQGLSAGAETAGSEGAAARAAAVAARVPIVPV